MTDVLHKMLSGKSLFPVMFVLLLALVRFGYSACLLFIAAFVLYLLIA